MAYLDFTLIGFQAEMFLTYARHQQEWLEEYLPKKASLSTAAFYNCRERGVQFNLTLDRERSINIVVGEHRNSDDLFLDYFVTKPGLNPPTIQDFTEEAYSNRKFFRYMDLQGAFEAMVAIIHYEVNAKEEK